MPTGHPRQPPVRPPPGGPDRAAALTQYQHRASAYDLELAPFEPLRRQAIARLYLQAGETVLDVGCGTGLSLEGLCRGVGEEGRVIGIEQCPEMLAQARVRAQALGHRHLRLLGRPAEEAPLTGRADAALLHFTHDILRCPQALDRVLRHLRPGARVVATGLQWAPPWAWPVNLFVWGAALRSVSSLQGLHRPWALLAERVDVLDVQDQLWGGVFLLSARCRAPG